MEPTIKNLHTLEEEIEEHYIRVLIPLSKALATRAPEHYKSSKGTPSVLFLGNHSSGKSSFINYLLEEELQKTGVAPVDDGFTVVRYGSVSDQFDGYAMATHGDLPFEGLEAFGEEFLSRAKLKTRPAEWLKKVTLIDSPGMIDAPESKQSRGYDFSKSVRFFAEHADLILFFFDPDKPGTTGETMNIFKDSLTGTEHKQLILLHKVDSFDNIRDFARTYGALCWNLSKSVVTKDLPHIYVTYLPDMASASNDHIPLEDFDKAREEVIDEIKRVPVRRLDNLVTELLSQSLRLSMVGRVIGQVAARYRSMRLKWFNAIALSVIAVAVATGYLYYQGMIEEAMKVGGGGLILIFILIGLRYFMTNSFKKNCVQRENIDQCFREAFNMELVNQNRIDLDNLWDRLVRGQVVKSIEGKGIQNMPSSRKIRKMTKACEAVMKETPGMRRKITRAEVDETEK